MDQHYEARLRIIGTDVYGMVMFMRNDGKVLFSNIPSEKVDYSKQAIYLTGKLMGGEHILAETFESWDDQVLTIEGEN